MTFPPPHRQIFIEHPIFVDVFLTVICCWPSPRSVYNLQTNAKICPSPESLHMLVIAGPPLFLCKLNKSKYARHIGDAHFSLKGKESREKYDVLLYFI